MFSGGIFDGLSGYLKLGEERKKSGDDGRDERDDGGTTKNW